MVIIQRATPPSVFSVSVRESLEKNVLRRDERAIVLMPEISCAQLTGNFSHTAYCAKDGTLIAPGSVKDAIMQQARLVTQAKNIARFPRLSHMVLICDHSFYEHFAKNLSCADTTIKLIGQLSKKI